MLNSELCVCVRVCVCVCWGQHMQEWRTEDDSAQGAVPSKAETSEPMGDRQGEGAAPPRFSSSRCISVALCFGPCEGPQSGHLLPVLLKLVWWVSDLQPRVGDAVSTEFQSFVYPRPFLFT